MRWVNVQDFVMIPRSLVTRKELGNKRVIAYASALFINWDGTNMDELVRVGGYSPNDRHKGSVLSQYKNLVTELHLDEFSRPGVCLHPAKSPKEGFCIIRRREFERILEARRNDLSDRYINQANVILLLATIRCYMYNDPEKPMYYSDMLFRLAERTGLSKRSLTAAISVLEQLEIIHSQELPRYQDSNKQWHANVRIFVEYSPPMVNRAYSWQEETLRGIQSILATQID